MKKRNYFVLMILLIISMITNVMVYASDGGNVNTYSDGAGTIQEDKGVENLLTNLTIGSGELTPKFSSNIMVYTSNVGFDTKSITVTPSSSTTGTAITINGNPAESGQPLPVSLTVGSNTINVVATNGEASQTYTITLVMASSAYFTKIDVGYKTGKTSSVTTVNMVNGQLKYNVDIPNSITGVTLTLYSQDTNAKINVNGNQDLTGGQVSGTIPVVVGTTRIPINATSSIGNETKEYEISIN